MELSVHPSALKIGAHYVMVSRTERGEKTRVYYGEFLSSKLTGRPYDPDVILSFENRGAVISFIWDMRSEFYEVPAPLVG